MKDKTQLRMNGDQTQVTLDASLLNAMNHTIATSNAQLLPIQTAEISAAKISLAYYFMVRLQQKESEWNRKMDEAKEREDQLQGKVSELGNSLQKLQTENEALENRYRFCNTWYVLTHDMINWKYKDDIHHF